MSPSDKQLMVEARDMLRKLLTALQECRSRMDHEPMHWDEVAQTARALIISLTLHLERGDGNESDC